MNKKKKQQRSKPLSSLKQKTEEHFIRLLKESREQHQALQMEYEKLYKGFSDIVTKLNECERKYKNLRMKSKEVENDLSYMKHQEAINKFLIKQTYSFLISEGYRYNYKANRWQRTEAPKQRRE